MGLGYWVLRLSKRSVSRKLAKGTRQRTGQALIVLFADGSQFLSQNLNLISERLCDIKVRLGGVKVGQSRMNRRCAGLGRELGGMEQARQLERRSVPRGHAIWVSEPSSASPGAGSASHVRGFSLVESRGIPRGKIL